ncbi:hypothetical protein HDU76_002551 [Blyttiomyces sp. JEL0837]|nr:hypothetical protein HDU76_002551 [Blyttiomyces sp. JEL0837]
MNINANSAALAAAINRTAAAAGIQWPGGVGGMGGVGGGGGPGNAGSSHGGGIDAMFGSSGGHAGQVNSAEGENAMPQYPPGPPGTYPQGTILQVDQTRVVVERFLAEGGFAHVYVVVIAATGEHAVLKRTACPDDDTLEHLKNEINFMEQVNGHKNIVTYLGSSISHLRNGGYEVFILMEYCSGGHLVDFLNTRLHTRLTESEILTIFSDVCEAVAHMHYSRNGPIIHRDIKVENVLISSDGFTYKLCDFGSATKRIIKPGTSMGVSEIRKLEDEVDRFTTLQYRAPELCDLYQRGGMSEKVDMWALGVLLYKLCYFTTPFEDHGKLAILNVRYSFPSHPVYSHAFNLLIDSMLTADVQSRANIYQVYSMVCSLRGVPCNLINIYNDTTTDRPATTTPTPITQMRKPSEASQTTALRVSGEFSQALNSAAGIAASNPGNITPMRRGRPAPKPPGSGGATANAANGTSNSASGSVVNVASLSVASSALSSTNALGMNSGTGSSSQGSLHINLPHATSGSSSFGLGGKSSAGSGASSSKVTGGSVSALESTGGDAFAAVVARKFDGSGSASSIINNANRKSSPMIVDGSDGFGSPNSGSGWGDGSTSLLSSAGDKNSTSVASRLGFSQGVTGRPVSEGGVASGFDKLSLKDAAADFFGQVKKVSQQREDAGVGSLLKQREDLDDDDEVGDSGDGGVGWATLGDGDDDDDIGAPLVGGSNSIAVNVSGPSPPRSNTVNAGASDLGKKPLSPWPDDNNDVFAALASKPSTPVTPGVTPTIPVAAFGIPFSAQQQQQVHQQYQQKTQPPAHSPSASRATPPPPPPSLNKRLSTGDKPLPPQPPSTTISSTSHLEPQPQSYPQQNATSPSSVVSPHAQTQGQSPGLSQGRRQPPPPPPSRKSVTSATAGITPVLSAPPPVPVVPVSGGNMGPPPPKPPRGPAPEPPARGVSATLKARTAGSPGSSTMLPAGAVPARHSSQTEVGNVVNDDSWANEVDFEKGFASLNAGSGDVLNGGTASGNVGDDDPFVGITKATSGKRSGPNSRGTSDNALV